MAFYLAVRCLPSRDGAEYWHVRMASWPAALRGDPRFRAVPAVESGAYRDDYAVQTTREALEVNAPYLGVNRELYTHGVEEAERLREPLTHRTPGGLVVDGVREWESGPGD